MQRRYILPFAILVFIIMFGAGFSVIRLVEDRHLREHRHAVAEVGRTQAAFLQRQLDQSLSATYALASVLRQNEGDLENFDGLAADMIRSYGGITNLQLAPDAIVSRIYPLAGHEQALGHDLLADENRRAEALAAIDSRRLTLAGPFELVQGGTAMIGRLPVFLDDDSGEGRFWGFSIALILMPDFVAASGLDQLGAKGYRYQLARVLPETGDADVFLQSEQSPSDPVAVAIPVPNGEWLLSVEPEGGWQKPTTYYYFVGTLFVVSFMLSVLVYSVLRQPAILRWQVDERTRELAESNELLQVEMNERIGAEAALRTSEARARAILETAPNGIIILDRRLTVSSFNSAAVRMFGYASSQIVGQNLAILVPDHTELFSQDARKSEYSDEIGVYPNGERDVCAVRKDGQGFPATISSSIVKLGGTEFYTIVVRDVTFIREMDRLKNEFVATVSHELRTPLAAVMGFLETVLSERAGTLNEVQQRHLQLSYTAAERLNRQIEELLTVSKIQQGRLQLNQREFKPAQMLESSVDVVSPLAHSKSIALQTSMNHEPVFVNGDRERLEQVIINLLNNAIKFTPPQGQVSLYSKIEDGRWHLSIEDTGTGISSDEIEHVFQRFYRGRNAVSDQIQGAGLGLYICRVIVEAHRGTISVGSIEGEGTVVSIMIPESVSADVPDHESSLHQMQTDETVTIG